ncbi:YtrH family sporulation protein [Metallumcola ferriviriculae]|uniref:YtrH family sporulation protein n=1 Tax=Metallumcola ferriviriculae TaxID=3039180 RepID=A0AAU0UQV0_9FIRM|nr:YtrH family sporulation protein [Desulfitibacteraceae bacterium MK1]
MDSFSQKMLLILFTSLGVELGASLVGALAAVLAGGPPLRTMAKLAYEIKIWAIVAAIGGTFTTIEVLELGLFEGELITVIKQILYIISAFAGAQLGYFILSNLAGGR